MSSNELVRAGQRALVKSDGSAVKTVGGTLVAGGAGGLALCAVAAFLPFIGVFGLSIVMVVVGMALWMASK